jgi:hypothetical protein
MQNPVLPKVIAEMLPNRHHPRQLSPVEQRRIGEPPLRPIDLHRPSSERRRMPLCPSMDLISFRHRFWSPLRKRKQWRRRWSTARTTVATDDHSNYYC